MLGSHRTHPSIDSLMVPYMLDCCQYNLYSKLEGKKSYIKYSSIKMHYVIISFQYLRWSALCVRNFDLP